MLNQEYLTSVPHSAGVYLMLGKSSTVLYVGKAKDLKKRLSSYVHFQGAPHNKTTVMLSQVRKVDFLMTNTEKEALILEASLIKRHRPKYNVILRDDKSYPLIKVTIQEKWPRVFMTRSIKRDGAKYFGPYASSSAMWATLNLLSRLFPLRRCKGANLKPRKRPCLNHQMNRCLAPCAGKVDHQSYLTMVDKVLMFLDGRNKNLFKDLQKEMRHAASSYAFEEAAIIRDQIKSITKTLEKQIVVSQTGGDRDVYGFARSGASVSIALLYVREGIVRGTRRFFLEDTYGDDPAILSQVIKQVYDNNILPPPLVLLPFQIEDQELLQERLTEIVAKKVVLSVPSRGDRLHLLSMANTNARQLFDEREKKTAYWNSLGTNIQKKLQLPSFPHSIECLDISNISGTNAVGSLVRFTDGEPDKSGYRHYKITTVKGPDDYAMMAEVIRRRFTKCLEDNVFPCLFVVDGGKGQLGIAEAIGRELGLSEKLNLLGIAKERLDEGEKLYKPGRKNPFKLPSHDPVLLYFMRIRDEAHRFGVTFHRSLRTKKTLTSELDRIPGVGPVRKEKLLKSIGSLKKISHATVEQLSEIDGIGTELAEQIHTYLSKG